MWSYPLFVITLRSILAQGGSTCLGPNYGQIVWRKHLGNATPVSIAQSTTMIKSHKRTERNDVKGTYSPLCDGPSSGNDVSQKEIRRQQYRRDRHPMTAASTSTSTSISTTPRNAKDFRSKFSKIATWNVRTLFQAGKLDNVLLEMNRMRIGCLGLCEIRWTKAGDFIKDNKRVLFSGGEQHHRGVALVLDRNFASSVLSFWPYSDRLMLVKLKSSPFNVNVIVAYAPTAAAEDHDISSFYASLQELHSSCKSNEVTIVMGDFNAKVGRERDGKIVGNFGLGNRNECGDKLVDWCRTNNMIITNTWFDAHPRRKYTWTSPGDRVRNQIDYVLVNSRFRNAVKNSHAYPGADIDSDHNPVVMKFKLTLKRVEKAKAAPKFKFDALDDRQLRERFRHSVRSKIPDQIPENIDDHWQLVTKAINESAEDTIPKEEKKKPSTHWFNPTIRDLLQKRRLSKRNPVQYRLFNAEFRRKCTEAKEQWLEEKCKEVENLTCSAKEMFRKISEITRKRTIPGSKCIKSADGRVLYEASSIASRWEEYVQDLFHDDNQNEEIIPETALSGPSILKSEIRWALSKMKSGKASGPDNIYTEMLQALEEDGIEIVWRLVNNIYEQGKFPREMLKSLFVVLPKIPGTLDCANHRTISLMSHLLKVLLKIVLQRIRRKILPEIPQTQFGFMKDRGTRNAIFVMRMLEERAIEHQQDIFLCFIDYQKAFDKVRHTELFKMLAKIQLDDKDFRVIRAVYHDQLAAVRLPGGTTNWFSIKRGVRQGCVMSPDLFNLYSETILRTLEDRPEGIEVGGIKINNLRYADDTVLLASSEAELQSLFDTVVTTSENLGLSINNKKTKCMVVSKLEVPPTCHLRHDKASIEQISSFNYLGALVTSDARCKREIRRRISIAKDAFMRLRPVLADRRLSVQVKIRVLKVFVWSTLMYACESWTLTAETHRNIEAAEMWFYRRMLRISYVDHVTNEEVLRRMGIQRGLLRAIQKRQLEFLGHAIRKEGIENLSLSGMFEGKRARGGQRKTFLSNFNLGQVEEIFRKARNRGDWKTVVRQTLNQ